MTDKTRLMNPYWRSWSALRAAVSTWPVLNRWTMPPGRQDIWVAAVLLDGPKPFLTADGFVT